MGETLGDLLKRIAVVCDFFGKTIEASELRNVGDWLNRKGIMRSVELYSDGLKP